MIADKKFRIPYKSVDFPSGTVASEGELEADWGDLIWAALTIGRPNICHALAHGEASIYEALFRLSLLRMAVEQRPGKAYLFRTRVFSELDPTEKGAVSYFLGMAVCKLFAYQKLGTPWLLHLDVFRHQLDPIIVGGRSRPDLVGQNHHSGNWQAFECKGRSTMPSAEEQRKAKKQAQRLIKVNGADCDLHVGAITYFLREKLEFYWWDPKPESSEELPQVAVKLTQDAWRHYYAPALALARDGMGEDMSVTRTVASIEEENRKDVRLGAGDVDVQIRADVRELLEAGDWKGARLQAPKIRDTRVKSFKLEEEEFKPDGLRIRAGAAWRENRDSERGTNR